MPAPVFIATSWNDGAVAQAFIGLGKELARRGHEAVVLTRKLPPDPPPELVVRAWPSPRPTGLADAAFFARLVREHRPGAVIGNFGAVNVTTLVGAALRVPVRIAWYHTLTSQNLQDSRRSRWRNEAQLLRKRLVLRAATDVVANSQAAADDVHQQLGVARDKLHVVLNSIPDPLVGLGALPARDPDAIVCVGRLSPSKGQETLIRALALLANRRAHATFVGTGECGDALAQLARELGVADRCRFVGQAPLPEVFRHVARAAIAVVPSLAEAFGLVNVEAMALGTPLAVSATGGITEVVRDDREALHFPPGDARALAAALDRLLADAALRERLSRTARSRFEAVFELGRATKITADWLQAVLHRRT